MSEHVIVLSAELAEKRQQARRVYPDARWLPGDAPPIGAVVRDPAHLIGIVEGEWVPEADRVDLKAQIRAALERVDVSRPDTIRQFASFAATVAHTADNRCLRHWWRVRLPSGETSIQWPPSLRLAGGAQ